MHTPEFHTDQHAQRLRAYIARGQRRRTLTIRGLTASLATTAKRLLLRTPLARLRWAYLDSQTAQRWAKGDRSGSAPHSLKRRTVTDYGDRFHLDTLIETGTYRGLMVREQRMHFREIVTIELDAVLAAEAHRQFRSSPNVRVIWGDSATVLPNVLATLTRPALFWLDAHYSGDGTAKADVDTPIVAELRAVLTHPLGTEHVVLIDDARCFDGTNDYPALDGVRSLVQQLRPGHVVEVRDDIIRIHAGPYRGSPAS